MAKIGILWKDAMVLSYISKRLVVRGLIPTALRKWSKEKQEVFSFVNKINAGRVALVAGIGGNDTHEVIEGFKSFDLKGYDAILSVSPYYNKIGRASCRERVYVLV